MKIEMMKQELVIAMEQLDEERVLALVTGLRRIDCDKNEIFDLLNLGAERVGDLFEQGEYYIADFMVSGKIYAKVLSQLLPEENDYGKQSLGPVLMGVVRHDIHDIGKEMIKNLFKAEGFRVIDLGVDVSATQFVAAAQRYHPAIIAISGLLTASTAEIQQTIAALEAAGIRSYASIVIGGACTDASLAAETNADFWNNNPIETLNYCLAKVGQDEN